MLMKEQILEILEDIRPDIDFESATKLIDDNMLDSFDIISVISELNDAFDISINVNDLVPDNFNTVAAMQELVEKLQQD